MKLPWWVSVAALLLGALTVGSLMSAKEAERAAADRSRIRGHEATIAALNGQIGRKDTVYLADTVRFTRWRQTWDTVRRVDTVTQRLVSVDTLRLVVRVADSTIAACSAALLTCEERTALFRERIAVDSATIRALGREVARARIRGRLACAAGPGASTKGVDYVSVTCGIRIF